MRASPCSLGILLVLVGQAPLVAQVTPRTTPAPTQVLEAARAIMEEARYCTLVTLGPGGQAQARIVDPFAPDTDLTIWIGTNPATRKVHDVQGDPRVTLLYFNATTLEYVSVIGSATLDTDSLDKAAHWKPEWAALYRDRNHGPDYVLLRVTPTRLEVVSGPRRMLNDPLTWRPVTLELSGSWRVLPN